MTRSAEQQKYGWQIVNEERLATPVEAHGYRVQPVAQISGWQTGSPTTDRARPVDPARPFMGGGAFWWIRPTVLQVEQADQPTQEILLIDPTQTMLWKLLWVAVASAAVAGGINWLIWRRYG